MSFPNVVYGSYGDQYTSQSTKIGGLPLGTKMVIPDGRAFRHAKAGGTTLTKATLQMTEAVEAGHDADLMVGVAAAIGAKTVSLTLAGTAVTLNQYEDGYLYVNDDTGEGYIHRVKSNLSCGSALDCAFTLADGESIQVALLADTTECGVRVNPYKNVVIYKAGTLVGQPLGIAPRAVTANYYFWLQTHGPAMCLVSGTHLIGEPLFPATAAVPGGIEPFTASSAHTVEDFTRVGYCMAVAASTDFGPIDLDIE